MATRKKAVEDAIKSRHDQGLTQQEEPMAVVNPVFTRLGGLPPMIRFTETEKHDKPLQFSLAAFKPMVSLTLEDKDSTIEDKNSFLWTQTRAYLNRLKFENVKDRIEAIKASNPEGYNNYYNDFVSDTPTATATKKTTADRLASVIVAWLPLSSEKASVKAIADDLKDAVTDYSIMAEAIKKVDKMLANNGTDGENGKGWIYTVDKTTRDKRNSYKKPKTVVPLEVMPEA